MYNLYVSSYISAFLLLSFFCLCIGYIFGFAVPADQVFPSVFSLCLTSNFRRSALCQFVDSFLLLPQSSTAVNYPCHITAWIKPIPIPSLEKTALLYMLSFGTTVCGLFSSIAGILGFLGAVCRVPCLLALTAMLLLFPLAASIYISNKETDALRMSVSIYY